MKLTNYINFKIYDENRPPKKPCVYRFHDIYHTVIYVGKATNLKSRLSAHFQDNSNTKEFIDQMYYVTYYEIDDLHILPMIEEICINVHSDTVYNKMLNGESVILLPPQENKVVEDFVNMLTIKDVLHKRPPALHEKYISLTGDNITPKKVLKNMIIKQFHVFIKDMNINGKTQKVYASK